MKRNRRMGIRSRVQHNAMPRKPRILNPGHKLAFDIGLAKIHRNAERFRLRFQKRFDAFQRQISVYSRFPNPKQIEIWSIEDKYRLVLGQTASALQIATDILIDAGPQA